MAFGSIGHQDHTKIIIKILCLVLYIPATTPTCATTTFTATNAAASTTTTNCS